MNDFDLIIIGGGAGAFAAAIKANQLGAKTLMVNRGLPLGGTCVNVGCVPSKHLLSVGELVFRARHHNFKSIGIPDLHFDFATAVKEEMDLVAKLRKAKYQDVLAQLPNITPLEGEAAFTSANEVEVNGKRIPGHKFIIATGSTAAIPSVAGLNEAGFITHIEALQLPELPKRLLIIGAGPLGLEFAQIFNNFGTEVNVLVRGNQVLSRSEPEVAQALENYLSRDGIAIWKNAQPTQVFRDGAARVVKADVGGREMEFRADEILVATGKTPNTVKLNLPAAGVATAAQQSIKVNQYYQTSVPHIYAAGDVIDKPLRLETTAGKEGSYAAENALSGSKKSIDYYQVPYAVFTHPAVAGVGLTDADVANLGQKCVCRTIDFKDVPKAQVIGDIRGVIKMVALDDGQVAGVHLVAPQAAEIINQAVYIIKAGMTVKDILDTLPVFPTLSESIKIVAQSFTSDISQLSCCT